MTLYFDNNSEVLVDSFYPTDETRPSPSRFHSLTSSTASRSLALGRSYQGPASSSYPTCSSSPASSSSSIASRSLVVGRSYQDPASSSCPASLPCLLQDVASPYLEDRSTSSLSTTEKLGLLCQLERINRILEEVSKRKPTGDRCGFTESEADIIRELLQYPVFHSPYLKPEFFKCHFSTAARAQLLYSHIVSEQVLHERITPVIEKELGDVLEKLSKFHVTPISFDSATDTEKALITAQYSIGEPIDPYIAEFDTTVPHTIPVDKYLDVRLSRTICKAMHVFNQMSRNTEVFIGNTEDLAKYYASKGYTGISQLGTNSSTKFYVVEHPDPRMNKLVIAGISNKSRFNNVLLQLKYKGVSLDSDVAVRGTVSAALAQNQRSLETALSAFNPPPYLAFVGNRTMVLIELANRLYPAEMAAEESMGAKERKAEQLLKANNDLDTVDIGGVFKFSYMTATIDGKKRGIIGFRMPNGSLSYGATRALIDSGVKKIVTVGAGGSLKEDLGVSSYQIISESQYQDKTVSLAPEKIMHIEIPKIVVAHTCKNRTVDSPLEEHKKWFEEVQLSQTSSVDVETFHILKAIQDSEADDVQYLPGIFTSDVVGAHPLVDKISLENAYPGLPGLIQGTFDTLSIQKHSE
ncbi:MAG: hypothetical protein JSR57_03025 [Verrucomicrobia bacterium]|nr:hypothetical protein [Verrucomicrobiota bacterium]